jgi:hypothetical protein
MAKTYSLIQAQTLTSNTASVTFSNIPQNFTDLRLFISCRSNRATEVDDQFNIYPNNSSSNLTSRFVRGDGSTVTSGTANRTYIPAAGATANIFSSITMIIPNYTNNKHKNIHTDSVQENNATTAYMSLQSTTWENTSAITSLVFSPVSGTAFLSGSTFILYGVGAHRASGGTITSDNNFTYHTFTSSGTFTALEKINGAEVLMIAGGGSGGKTTDTTSYGAGGGGAGGVFYATRQNLFAGTSYSAIVGAGGSDSNGSNSQFSSLVNAIGGGKGGNASNTAPTAGSSGGSGGGGTYQTLAGGSTTQSSTGGIGYGNAGGAGSPINGVGGGGGGAGAVGSAGAGGNQGGNGGIGLTNFAAWASMTNTGINGYYAGGGAGAGYGNGSYSGGIGGYGGGGKGGGTATGSLLGTAGTANTGGGGGASTQTFGNIGSAGGAGGSGLVIIRYPTVE